MPKTDRGEEHTCDLLISYAEADRAWVEGYLLDALTRASVEYHSEAAFALGVPRLLEFERAVQESARTLLVLSPAYLAEGFARFTDLLAQSYGLETATWPVIPLVLHPVELPPRLAMLTALDATDEDDWEAVVGRLCAELERPAPGPAPRPSCPYPGMVPFSEADSKRFFGRDAEVQDLLEQLRLHPFLTVIGPSGSGKSSLVFAGLIPALRKSGLFGPGNWLVRSMRPGDPRLPTPYAALADALEGDPAHLDRAVAQLLRTPRSNDFSRSSPAETSAATTNDRLLLVVDQFEELFTGEGVESTDFEEALLRLVQVPNCTIVLTARADFYPDLMASPLWPEIRAHRLEVLPLDEDGLREAIVRPTEDVGVFVEAALVDRLVADAAGEPGILPFVQETMVLLWERVERRFLPLRAYEALVLPRRAYGGPPLTGLQVAMARRADAALAALTPEQQAIARRNFLRLIQFGEGRPDVRRQQPVTALRSAGDDSDEFDRTLEHLTDNRLLTQSGEEEGPARRVDIAHEALISGWPKLERWLRKHRQADQTRRRLEAKVAEWQRLGGGGAGLLDEVELLKAERWVESPDAAILGYTDSLPRLVDASREAIEEAEREREKARQRELAQARALAEAERQATEEANQRAEAERQRAEEQDRASRRLRLLAQALAAVGLLAVTAAVTAGILGRRSATQAQVATSRQLAAQAVDSLASQSIDLSLLLAVESWRVMQGGQGPIWEADDALRRTLAQAPALLVRGGGSAVAFSPDGQTFATGSAHGAQLWDASSGRELALMQPGETVTALAYSPDEARLAIGSDVGCSFKDGVVRIWSLDKGGEPVELRQRLDPQVKQLVFSPNGRWLAAHYEEPDLGRREVRLCDTVAGREWIPPEACSQVGDVTFSADGNHIAVAAFMGACLLDADSAQVSTLLETEHQGNDTVQFSLDGNSLLIAGGRDASVWDIESHTQRASWHDVWAEAFALSPDGVWLAIVEEGVRLGPDGLPADNLLEDFRVVVRDTNTGRDMAVMHHSSPVDGVRFTEDGARLVSWSVDGTVRVWDAGLGSELAAFRHGFALSALDVCDDGNRLASAGGYTVHVWEFAKGSEHQLLPLGIIQGGDSFWTTFLPARPIVDLGSFRHDMPVAGLAFSPEGRRLVTTGLEGTTRLWDARGGQEPLCLRHEDEVRGFDLNFDGSQLVSATSAGARTWNVAAGREVARFGAVDYVSEVAASPDGRRLADFSLLGPYVLLLDVGSGDTVAVLEHSDGVKDVAFSPDSLRVATASSDGTACLWGTDGGDRLHVLPHEAAVEQAVWSADGSRLVTSAGEAVRVWDVATGKELQMVHGERGYDALAISAEGVLLGATPLKNTAQVWDVVRNRLLATLGHHDLVTAVAFSPDGSVLATASLDGTARLWEVRTGQPLAVLQHAASVYQLSFSADGTRLATGTGDTNVRVWRVHTQDLAAQACQVAGRNLTLEEWKTYVGEAARYQCTCPDLPPSEGAPADACDRNAND